ncbi:hypothetical protein B7R74_04850 [Yersinia pseudotuberculosis]|uniref:DUF7079 domain-containing protein n=3 Tax=Yersinia pseudotuberculosis complex TaxID=1649845 RepID=A0A0T9PC75_9GAMM|nr:MULTISPECIES: hypothetical protein [Yersinia pseudotuberculosis complex]AHK18996.1 hypothetical protein BF17_06435 [Yersinia similis]PSH22909.1 hypothetical protein B7R74_04850 [Yersinia pseudotuberculosis]CFQ59825.1 Uncharacterised protein [Yersinia similis]CNB33197.1 Uncharacterised protein [Yersinia similis]CNE68436.1 Uncharacterised protein [Yersinia similis]
MNFTEDELSRRIPVWYALSDLFTARELQDYDYKWMAEVLNASGYSRETLFEILDEEVAPALLGNLLFNPTPVIDGWEQKEVKDLVLRHLNKKLALIEWFIPHVFLLKKRQNIIRKERALLSEALDEY